MTDCPTKFDGAKLRELEKRIVWKLDACILPLFIVIFLVAFLDKANIANATIAGLPTDLHLRGTQLNVALSLFFITYILTELPSNIFLKKMKANRWISFMIGGWGLVTALTGLVQGFSGLVTVRLFLGLFEGGLAPCASLYVSYIYKRHELQFRVGVYYAASTFGSFLSGLLAAAITKMDGVGKLAVWRWIFILEGLGTVLIAIVTFFVLPSEVESAWFLTEEERKYAAWRPKHQYAMSDSDTVDVFQGHHWDGDEFGKTVAVNDIDAAGEEPFEWREIWRGLMDIQTWLTGLASMGIGVNFYSFVFFFPTIVANLGYTGSDAQIHTVPPYALAAGLIVIVSLLSDRLKLRGPFVLIFLPVTMIGYIMTLTATTRMVEYVGCCLIAAGIYPSTPSFIAILANNTSGHYKRAAATAMQYGLGNIGSIIGTYIYTPDQKPKYRTGRIISLAFVILVWVFTALNMLYCMWENKARREGRRDGNIQKYKVLRDAGLTKAPIGDRDPKFIFTL